MRAPLLLATLALLSCGGGQLGGPQPHGPMVATAGNWVPSEAAMAAVAGFPRSPFAGGGGGFGQSGPFTSGLEVDGAVPGPATAAGVQLGSSSSFPGVWLVGGGATPNTSNYSLLNAGPLCVNGTGQGISFRDGNTTKAGVDVTYGLTNAVATGTAGSGTGITAVITGAVRHYTHVITVARTALTAAGATQDITLWTVPARTRVRAVIADGTAAFDDGAGGISALTITCGKTAGGAEYLLSGSLFTINTLGDVTGEVGASLTTYFGDIPSWTATTAIQCRFTSTGGNLSTLTTGSATFYLEMESLP